MSSDHDSRGDRRGRRLPFDGHVHTSLSPDSDVAIDAYARQAVELGIPEIAITDHVDFDPRAPAYAYSTFEERRRIVRDAAHRWAPLGLAIRFGVELTYERAWEDAVRHHVRQNSYDFVIGSVHVGADSPYLAGRVEAWIAGKSLPEIVAPYYQEVEAAARSELFDAIGHIDFVKRYLAPHITAADLATAPELLEPVLRALVEIGDRARDQYQRPAPGIRRDLSVGGHGRSLPRARRVPGDGRVRCARRPPLRVGPVGRLRRGRGRRPATVAGAPPGPRLS